MHPARPLGLAVVAFAVMVPGQVALAPARTQIEGILQRHSGTLCIETHVLLNQCVGGVTQSWDVASSTVDLTQYECQYVRVEGTDVGWCPDPVYEVQTVTPLPAPCVSQVQSLEVHEQAGTWLQWGPVPCMGLFDVIRGDLPGPRVVGSSVDLGRVRCLANDTPGLSTFNDRRDTDIPVAGLAFFYLVRAAGAAGVTPYGFSSGGLEEIPASHDCRL